MKIKNHNITYTLPDCLIVGAAKSGTTALYKFLEEYDEVFCPNLKEPWFFSHMNESFKYVHPITKEDLSRQLVTNINEYCSLFNEAKDNQLILEASTSYLYTSDKVISNMKEIYGDKSKDVKIIAILRNIYKVLI